MHSIRLALLLYFLGLVTLALGATSLLAYRSAKQTLRDKEEASSRLIQAKHEDRCREEQTRLDAALLARAKGLARRVQVQILPVRFREAQVVAGITAAQASGNAHFLLPLWAFQAGRPPFYPELMRRLAADLQLHRPETELMLPAEGDGGEYYQIESNYRGPPLRSRSLGDHAFPGVKQFAPEDMLRWEFDDFELNPGHKVRRIRLKAASARRAPFWMPRGGRNPAATASPGRGKNPEPAVGPPRPPGNRPNPPNRRREDHPLAIYVQCGADTTALAAKLGQLRDSRDGELAAIREETTSELARQRNQMLGISGTAFLGTILGACWLVWAGLLPLRRLGDADSKVSPRDFRLDLGDAPMPAELRPIIDRLNGTLELLKRAFAREKQSTADISHELRTPLSAMLTTLELALRKPRSAEQYREMIADCQHGAMQMNQVIERLLTLARLDAGVDRLRPQAVDVVELARECAGVVRPLAESQGLSLAIHACRREGLPAGNPEERPTARLTTDPDKLREVINNLLHNAVQYNRPQGRIDLTVGRAPAHVQVEISDTGIGIAPEARERIFERFFRADPSRTSDGMNAGLGLAIVKEYVELMGGRISVESVVGQGSTFRVQLPLESVAPAA